MNACCDMEVEYLSNDTGSYFDNVLPLEIIRIIFSHIKDVTTFIHAQKVNRLWSIEIQIAWRHFCEISGLLEDEMFWTQRTRNPNTWKWISVGKHRKIPNIEDISKKDYYVGCFEKYDVQGNQIWSYEGEWRFGERHGNGTLRLPSGSAYKGEWKYGERDGSGYLVFVNPSSSYYNGTFKQGKRHGVGLCVWVAGQWAGDQYYGEWDNDCMTGYGRYTFASGSYYEGHWKEDKMVGDGTYKYRSGNEYTGTWLDDKMHGKGQYKYNNGNLYIGDMNNDSKHGYGRYFYADYEAYYEGTFTNNKPNNFGVYYWKDGYRYEGTWIEGRRSGKGRLISPDGVVYEQEWTEAIKHPYTNQQPAKFHN